MFDTRLKKTTTQISRHSIAQKTCSMNYCMQLQTVPHRCSNIITCFLTVTKNRTVWDSIGYGHFVCSIVRSETVSRIFLDSFSLNSLQTIQNPGAPFTPPNILPFASDSVVRDLFSPNKETKTSAHIGIFFPKTVARPYATAINRTELAHFVWCLQ